MINELISDNKILLFFLDEKKSTKTILLRHLIVFFLVPIILLLLSYFDGILFIEGVDSLGNSKVGMLEDYLFLYFLFIYAPLFLIILRIILKRFIHFIDEIPSFTKNLDSGKYDSLVRKYIKIVKKRRLSISLLKYSIAAIMIYSNITAFVEREGGWNSLTYMVEFMGSIFTEIIIVLIILPQVLEKYVLIIISQIQLTKQLDKKNSLDIKPIAPDKSGGLKSLGDLSLSFTYFLIPFMIQMVMHYFTWDFLTVGFILGIIGLIPLTTVVFFYPLGIVHKAMEEAKRNTLKEISDTYVEINQSVMGNVKVALEDKYLSRKRELVELLDIFYEKANGMPVWPFNTKTLTRFFAVAFGPAVIVLLEVIFMQVITEFIQ